MDGRVGRLALRVRAPAGRLNELGPAAERFAVRVLTRCDELLSEHSPGRIVLMRSLDMKWRLLTDALDHEGEIEAFASELAETLDENARGAHAPSEQSEVVVFENEIDWRAEYLAAVPYGGRRAWFFELLGAEGEPPGALVLPENRAMAREVLVKLQTKGRLAEALAALSGDRLRALAAPAGAPGSPRRPASRAPLPEALEEAIAQLETSSREVAALSLFVSALSALGPAASEEDVVAASESALRAFLSRGRSEIEPSGPGAFPVRQKDRETEPGESIEIPRHDQEIDSEFGGLFYLLGPALELGLGEALWKVCLPEGAVLTTVASAILGAAGEHDPAASLFGGAPPRPELPSVQPDQQAEVSLALLVSFIQSMPRRGLADLPTPVLTLAGSPAGRLLLASAADRPFAFFAWPVPSPETVSAGLRAFLAAWPANAQAPRAGPALAELDPSARVRPDSSARCAPGLLVADASDLNLAALLTQSAGTLCHLFASRANAPASGDASALVDRHLRVPARIALFHETMDVVLPMERIDSAVRRAGLDANPGWVPWLRRRVTFTFEDDAVLPNEERPEA